MTPIIIGHHGYCVIVGTDSARIVTSDHRGVHDVPGGEVSAAEAGSIERAISAAVLMPLRLDLTAAQEARP